MALLMGDLRAALIAAGAGDDLANKAATEVASFETLRQELSVLKWMVGSLYPLVLAILLKLFLH